MTSFNASSQNLIPPTGYYNFSSQLTLPSKISASEAGGAIKEKINFTSYDSYGHILSQQKTGDAPVSYIYDYNNTYPVAQAVNALPADISYTSFEADGNGGWTYTATPVSNAEAPTGKKVFPIQNNTITRSGLDPAKTYIVNYWGSKVGAYTVTGTTGTATKLQTVSMGSTNWTYFRHTITGVSSTTISSTAGGAKLDELRLYPDDAEMNTYTFDPLTGVTTQCDANGRLLYYEYDDLGRLKTVKDADRNIIKKYCYNYAGQVTDCGGYTNAAITKVFFKQGCSSGYAGSEYAYTINAGTYTSQVSQADADQQALAALNANGQQAANTNGSCLLKAGVSCVNYSSYSGYTVTFQNIYDNTIQASYTYSSALTNQVISLGTLPQGTYRVMVTKSALPKPMQQFMMGCTPTPLYMYSQEAVFNNVSVSTGSCNQITIGDPPLP